jgi:amino acid transporter
MRRSSLEDIALLPPADRSRAGSEARGTGYDGLPKRRGTVPDFQRNHVSEHVTEHKHGGIGQLSATAICGNDITSSCLYVSALAILYAGALAPVALLIVAAVLYLFRSIYGEVVGALPLNGGAYNALLNTTSKFRASIAACLTILSYMATAVISASEAMHYAHALWSGWPVTQSTIALLTVFASLAILGISDSARVAVVIFLAHLATLTALLLVGAGHVTVHGLATLTANVTTRAGGSLSGAVFFGFSAALLGISGFESSANFVEEQAEGVFPKTLRNMWVAVTVFNPCIALLALAAVSIADVDSHQEALLAHLADTTGGAWFSSVVSVDAVLVLSGAVLTSFVGVNGLVRRMSLDRCLPQLLLKTNRRGTTHRIIVGFLLLAVSVFLITGGELKALAGVYTLSFLAVMVLFGVGNVLLKINRAGLPRPERASWPGTLLAIATVSAGLVGNVLMNPAYVAIFFEYFAPALLIVSIMLGRIAILKATLFVVQSAVGSMTASGKAIGMALQAKIDHINAQQLVFFTRGDDLSNLNNAMIYVRENEHTNRLKIVTVVKDEEAVPHKLRQDLTFLNEAYPAIDIEFVVIIGTFGPTLIAALSKQWRIPTNLMFIGSPSGHLIYGLAELGGVRLII